MAHSTGPEQLSPAIAGVVFPSSPLISSALQYVRKNSLPITYNHIMRSAYFALILSKKLPSLSGLSPTLLVLATTMHDLGWPNNNPDNPLISTDKRFEVDGANAAREFIRATDPDMPEADIQLIWDAIALHTTTSIAAYKEPEVAACSLGVSADFMGPDLGGGGLITPDEWRVVVKAFPHIGFTGDGFTEIMCGLCRTKPETTYDNFVSGFGMKYVEGYAIDGKTLTDQLEQSLKNLEKWQIDGEDNTDNAQKQ